MYLSGIYMVESDYDLLESGPSFYYPSHLLNAGVQSI